MNGLCRLQRRAPLFALLAPSVTGCRCVSTTGAINKGLRASQRLRGEPERFKPRNSSGPDKTRRRSLGPPYPDDIRDQHRRKDPFRTRARKSGSESSFRSDSRRVKSPERQTPRTNRDHSEDADRESNRLWAKPREPAANHSGRRTAAGVDSRERRFPRTGQAQSRGADREFNRPRARAREPLAVADSSNDVPIPVRYTTSSSQFVYGFNAVYAALKAGRRKAYVLHVQKPRDGQPGVLDRIPRTLTKDLSIEHHRGASALDQMSGDRPHNGVVLEASALPFPPVVTLENVADTAAPIRFATGSQSKEDLAINGTATSLPRQTSPGRHPLVLLLDGILDEGNLGGVLRAAAFLGVDAVAIVTATCAPLSPVMVKASSGASEIVPLLAVKRASDFVRHCRTNGWAIWASVVDGFSSQSVRGDDKRVVPSAALHRLQPCEQRPCILMIGGEGEGLHANLIRAATNLVTIRSKTRGDATMADFRLDSLNVSVATALLAEAFTRGYTRNTDVKAS